MNSRSAEKLLSISPTMIFSTTGPITGIDASAREDQRSRGKGERARALDDQQLGWRAGHVAHDEDEDRRQGVRVRPALAPDAALRPRLRQASPDVVLAALRAIRPRPECCGRVRLMQIPTRR